MKPLRVCVIGAGVAGLAAARHLTSQLNVFDVSVFEQASSIGGTWVYNENSGTDENGVRIHSSMYRNLRTNLPKEVMAYPDFPFPPEWPSFMTRHQVLRYLEDYANSFDLYKYIHLNSAVTNVRPIVCETNENPQWEVTVENVLIKEVHVLQFDTVIVCNGHFSVPCIPVIPGLESFPGIVMHSHDYRHPDIFQGKRVVIVGGSFSGRDICLDITESADIVYLSHKHRHAITCKLPDNVELHCSVTCVSIDGTVHFEDGQQRETDAILLCTGYHYSFPFLDQACGIQVTNDRVTHLYKHIFNTKFPTMSFIGLASRACGIFKQSSLQAQYVAAVLSKEKYLPSEEEMNAAEEHDFQGLLSRGLREKDAHCMRGISFDYNDTIAELAGADRIGPFLKSICEHVIDQHTSNMMDYKSNEYKLTSDGMWTVATYNK
ncbi:uncharacterized protein [Montipora foliosa]|uniref:uncharacterized protein n=1 Tax=Montipora foliosa TaxID=591990 RepID=UPI0035F175C4